MPWFQILQDGPEYEARKFRRIFTPPNVSLKDLHRAVPRRLFDRSTFKGVGYTLRQTLIAFMVFYLGSSIKLLKEHGVPPSLLLNLWVIYWGLQGMVFAGFWCLGHEAGHYALSPFPIVNNLIGLAMHTFVLTPYFSWRITHHTHHRSTNHLERDETYIPPTRKDFRLPHGKVAVKMDYTEIFEETPAYILFKLFVRQFFGFQLYLLHNRKGNPKYPSWTSHYRPSSTIFRPKDRYLVFSSNVFIVCMIFLLWFYGYRSGWGQLIAHYIMPWLFAHNWLVLFTYLQHSDPTIPYYRKDEWTFTRGALATVDRPLFGWAGRFLLHNISSDHVAHHFFPTIPFYNLPEVTEAIKPILGEYYNYDSTPAVYALWRSFTQCVFVEDEGDILFFRNRHGESLIEPTPLH